MNLQIVAIKTGSMTLNQLNIENQFQMTDSEEDTNYFEKYNKNVNFESDSESNRDLDEMDMYDVIVAGVAIL